MIKDDKDDKDDVIIYFTDSNDEIRIFMKFLL